MSDDMNHSDKTEESTEKKRDDAFEKGDLIKSQDIVTWFVLCGCVLVIALFSAAICQNLSLSLGAHLSRVDLISLDGSYLYLMTERFGMLIVTVVILPMLLVSLSSVAGNMVQQRFIFVSAPLKPKWNRVSLSGGFKRLFSSTSLMNFVKGIAKLSIVGIVVFSIIWPQRNALIVLIGVSPFLILEQIRDMILQIMVGVLAITAPIALLDYSYQRFIWNKKQRMTLKEVRDEHKQMEGDPKIRAKLRQIRMERGRKRMISSLDQASVIITNPKHYAIALRYESGMNAPVCLARGVDLVALKIREIAESHAIPIVENPPLARALYAVVQIEEEIPVEHYKAVAEVIRYVMLLRSGGKGHAHP
ncbi:MAG: flagellar type III secretion system protein FlhB [Alphaproteobacteria bacterium]|nr:flagellar type III secretion system protein FlhB [Alphaproteobacteria bacterium]